MTMRKETNAHTQPKIHVVHKSIDSAYLGRHVRIELYMPPSMKHPSAVSLLLINDGQDLPKMQFKSILEDLYNDNLIEPVLCVGIHCGKDRRHEYGTAKILDYKERGSKASDYTKFIFQELLPFIRKETHTHHFKHKSFAGFSLGGLMAMDIVWNHPYEFLFAGVFSGSFWWRTKALEDGYVEETDRIMHAQIREGNYAPWLKFFFQTGVLDETADRNNNGIIDSIDDTMDLIKELEEKGYNRETDIVYLEYKDGRHDVPTWGRAFPEFLKWAFGNSGGEGSRQ